MMRISALSNFAVIATLYMIVMTMQYFYDLERNKYIAPPATPSASFIKAIDLGLHSAVASFLWIETRTGIPNLQYGLKKFKDDLNLINTLDPKFNTPYVYTVLVLPESKHPESLNAAIEIGEKGIEAAEPNWKLPFYMASIYHINLKDTANAAKYFDIAAHTSGIPEKVKLFAINYGIYPNYRKQTIAIWQAVYETVKDEPTKERAKAHVLHFEILDFLQNAAEKYKERYGDWPENIDNLVSKNFIKEIPTDPFGLSFKMYKTEGLVGIK